MRGVITPSQQQLLSPLLEFLAEAGVVARTLVARPGFRSALAGV